MGATGDKSGLVVVTGASAGIGSELARVFAKRGRDLLLVARREARLNQLAAELEQAHGVTTHRLTLDLAEADAPERLMTWFETQGQTLDVLVNNAGFGLRGPFVELPEARQAEMLDVNIRALTRLCRLALPGLLARRRGGILNVASVAAFQPGPYMAVYYASKAYVLFLSEALAEEVRGQGVTVSCLCPGPSKTEFTDVAGFEFKGPVMSARSVAEAGLRGFEAGRTIIIPGLNNKLVPIAVQLLPRGFVRRMVARVQR